MPAFSAGEGGTFTPSITADNWTLDADTAGDFCKVVSIGWGGRLNTATGYRTRWVRPSTAGVTSTAVFVLQPHTPGYATALCRVVQTWTTEPVLPTDPENLHSQDWNAFGGLGYIVMPLSTPWWIVNGVLRSSISCRNVAGVDANGSGYTVTFEE